MYRNTFEMKCNVKCSGLVKAYLFFGHSTENAPDSEIITDPKLTEWSNKAVDS